jgi:hypothetical protein
MPRYLRNSTQKQLLRAFRERVMTPGLGRPLYICQSMVGCLSIWAPRTSELPEHLTGGLVCT